MLLQLPGVLAHLVVVATAAGMAGVDGGEHFRGSRSSGNDEFGATVHRRRGWWALWAPGSALSAVTCSVWTEANQNDDGDKSDAGDVSVSMETRATMS